jgi:hypothetical protein
VRVLDANSPSDSLALASSAALFALFDALLVKGVLERSEIFSVIKTAEMSLGGRAKSTEGIGALKILETLREHFPIGAG